ncbi:Crp/Fnr family transcriptional regulator [Lysobacter silvisoli]|uniref:CRP-like protein Clp n=1 Tax=Lysobacter silvisoli TaxID=2293254 RepID=A0A371K4A8_9GAMM|nr:Crp/Fnr family transcriptional regulator [Lysobacter silvisoli]RDZ28763.1 Crp/Fnr family transcriptional regulator [Lysobacter silvisoli]
MNKAPTWIAHNGLLDKLPAEACAALRPHLQLVDLPAGKVVFEPQTPQHHMYFPRSGIVSLLYVMENGDSSEIAMVGREGAVGMAILVDSQTTPARAVVQVGGQALALKADKVEREFGRGTHFQFLLLRYTQALLAQMAQMVVCNQHHMVEQKLCRWLLQCLDRVETDELQVTQELIATRLGVRREGVTEAAGRLQEAGLIAYSRGKIRLLDRLGLEQRSCECHAAVKREYERLLVPMDAGRRKA